MPHCAKTPEVHVQSHTNSTTNANANADADTHTLSAVGAELHHLKDALGLQLHLGGKDAAQLWERVGKAITRMEGELKTLGAEFKLLGGAQEFE